MATSPINNRDEWIEVMEPRLKKLFTYGLDSNEDWKKFWQEKQSDSRREEVAEFVKPDVTVETPEGANYVTLNTSIVRTSAVVHVDYTGSIIITHQMKRDKKYDEMEAQNWGLGEAVARKPHEMAVALMYNGFTTSKSADEVAWFSNSHPLKNAPTLYGDNLITTALGPQGINDALVNLQSTLNENGKPIPMGSKKVKLFVPPALAQLGRQLTMKGDYLPNSANFNRNTFDLECIPLPFLNLCTASHQQTQYYVQDSQYCENYFYEREGPTYDMVTDPLNDNTIIKVRHAFSFHVAGWRGTVGSTGLG